MQFVFVLDTDKHPLDPVHPGRARHLLSSGKAAVFKRYPFTIILQHKGDNSSVMPLRIKLDPGSRTTGIAVVDDQSGKVVFAGELTHRGQAIKALLDERRALRRSRRQRHTRYRKPRFENRSRSRNWLAPSLESRVCNIMTWVQRLRRLCAISAISLELVRFDQAAMEQPDIQGCQYQQGTLEGYEVREYLLEKWGRTCAYCGKNDTPLQVEHIIPRVKGGTDRVSNLTLACEACNMAKGSLDIRDWLAKRPTVLERILAQAQQPLKDAAAVNTTRRVLWERLRMTGLPVECGSGGRTKYNRTQRGLPKTHWCDATCVGASTPQTIQVRGITPLLIIASGHGSRKMCGTNAYGFPIRHRQPKKRFFGFQTGDLVRAHVPRGRNQGNHQGRVLIRASGSFDIVTGTGRRQGISYRYCSRLHRADGYRYEKGGGITSSV